jgi:hypothetical protein
LISLPQVIYSGDEEMIRQTAPKAVRSKTSLIAEDVDKKIVPHKSREQMIQKMAGWLTHQEAKELRQAVKVFERIDKGYKSPR